MSDRIEQIKAFLAQTPDDEFLNYALAIEYVSSGRHSEAVALFNTLKTNNPDYSATYYQLGKLHEMMGNTEEAIKAYEQGIEVTRRLNERKNLSELQSALGELTEDY